MTVAWAGLRALTSLEASPLDLSAAVGQMQYSYRFALSDAVTGEELGDINPIRTGSLSHDTTRTTKRTLSLSLGSADTEAINTLTDRVSLFMVIPGAVCPDTVSGDWPLGRYQFVDGALKQFTSGNLSQPSLTDEMFLIDQEIGQGISGVGQPIASVLVTTLTGLPITFRIDPSPFTSADAWSVGTNRGQILEALATAGDYWSPWFDNTGVLRFVRTFNPAKAIPDFDYDNTFSIIRDSITRQTNLLTAPNTVLVVSNNSSNGKPAVGRSTVPVNAPNSVANRGFAVTKTYQVQLSDPSQAQAVADGLMRRLGIFETATLSTPADPRHDSYNVIRWESSNWLELAWSMPLTPGAPMVHTIRRAYT